MSNIIPVETVAQKIYMIRGFKVMLDSDLAELYGVRTHALNQAVKRNRFRFPADFMFALSRSEIQNISQFVISSTKIKHSKNINVFTEQGVAMLSSILTSKRAIHVSIMIMRAFVKIRDLLSTHRKLADKINEMEKKYDKQFAIVFTALKQLIKTPEIPSSKQFGFRAKRQ
jgi:hypothetical protein